MLPSIDRPSLHLPSPPWKFLIYSVSGKKWCGQDHRAGGRDLGGLYPCGLASARIESFLEIDLADLFEDFSEQLGVRMKAGFWETGIDWNDREAGFGELVRKLTTELNAGVSMVTYH